MRNSFNMMNDGCGAFGGAAFGAFMTSAIVFLLGIAAAMSIFVAVVSTLIIPVLRLIAGPLILAALILGVFVVSHRRENRQR